MQQRGERERLGEREREQEGIVSKDEKKKKEAYNKNEEERDAIRRADCVRMISSSASVALSLYSAPKKVRTLSAHKLFYIFWPANIWKVILF